MVNEIGTALTAAGLVALAIFEKFKIQDKKLNTTAGVVLIAGLIVMFVF